MKKEIFKNLLQFKKKERKKKKVFTYLYLFFHNIIYLIIPIIKQISRYKHDIDYFIILIAIKH